MQQSLRTIDVHRYVLPLREGGSLPAIVEGDDSFLYALKFRGAGQGVKALIAELLGGEIARTLGLRVPELVFATVDPAFGRTEPDEEIQDLLKASAGLNLALHYLSGSITFDPNVAVVDGRTASQIIWLDSLITNVDRTVRNTNMLLWYKDLWLIDHGAALYFHHNWTGWEEHSRRPFLQIRDHVLLPWADKLEEVDAALRQFLTAEKLDEIVSLIPAAWALSLNLGSADEVRDVYAHYLKNRLSTNLIKPAQDARQALV